MDHSVGVPEQSARPVRQVGLSWEQPNRFLYDMHFLDTFHQMSFVNPYILIHTPVAQAALTANTRTAAFARTGEYPDEDGDGIGGAAGGYAHSRRGGARNGAGGSYDSSILSTGQYRH